MTRYWKSLALTTAILFLDIITLLGGGFPLLRSVYWIKSENINLPSIWKLGYNLKGDDLTVSIFIFLLRFFTFSKFLMGVGVALLTHRIHTLRLLARELECKSPSEWLLFASAFHFGLGSMQLWTLWFGLLPAIGEMSQSNLSDMFHRLGELSRLSVTGPVNILILYSLLLDIPLIGMAFYFRHKMWLWIKQNNPELLSMNH